MMRADRDNDEERLPRPGETLKMRAVAHTEELPIVSPADVEQTQPMRAIAREPDPEHSTRQVISPASGAFAFFKSLEDAWAREEAGSPDDGDTQLMPQIEVQPDETSTELLDEGFLDDIDPTEFDDVPDTMLTVGPVEPGASDEEAPVSQVTVAPLPRRLARPSEETASEPAVGSPKKTQRRRGRRASEHDTRRRADLLREKLGITASQRGPYGEVLAEPAEPAFPPPPLHATGPAPRWNALRETGENDLGRWVDTRDFGQKIEASTAPPPPVANLPGQRGALAQSEEFQRALQIFQTLPATAQRARAQGHRFTDLASVTYAGQPRFDGSEYTLSHEHLTGVSRALWDHCVQQGYACRLVPHFGRMRKGFQVEFWIRILW